MSMTATELVDTWYTAGQRIRERLGDDLPVSEWDDPDAEYDHHVAAMLHDETGVVSAAWHAGYLNAPVLEWVDAWRYGEIPESGSSTNYRDQIREAGVSVMALGNPEDGDDETDGTFAVWTSRPVVLVSGWLVRHRRGSDGEPLLVGAVRRSS